MTTDRVTCPRHHRATCQCPTLAAHQLAAHPPVVLTIPRTVTR